MGGEGLWVFEELMEEEFVFVLVVWYWSLEGGLWCYVIRVLIMVVLYMNVVDFCFMVLKIVLLLGKFGLC